MINLAKMPPHWDLFERREESCFGVKTGPIAGCLGISQGSIQAEWQPCTWLKVTATSGRLGHYFPTHSLRGERAWSDRPQSALHYHLATAKVATSRGRNRRTTSARQRGKIKVLHVCSPMWPRRRVYQNASGCLCSLGQSWIPVGRWDFEHKHKGQGRVKERESWN